MIRAASQFLEASTRTNDARGLTLALGGKWYSRFGAAPCPVCQPDRRRGQNALTIAESSGRLLLHCKKSDCAFIDILAAAGIMPGTVARPDPTAESAAERAAQAQAAKRAAQAARLWSEAQPIGGTIAAHYLRNRMVTCDLPPTLRFHPECWHASGKRHQALVALVEGVDAVAVHRTYLLSDGSGKADADPPKAMLGAVLGGAVRLSDTPGPLVVAEGIETALSLASGLLNGPVRVWAALSASGMRGLRLPSEPGKLTVATDGDAPGRAAGQALAERAHRLGWRVSLLPAPDGRDWNDVLRGKVVAA